MLITTDNKINSLRAANRPNPAKRLQMVGLFCLCTAISLWLLLPTLQDIGSSPLTGSILDNSAAHEEISDQDYQEILVAMASDGDLSDNSPADGTDNPGSLKSLTVHRGDTLTGLFEKVGLKYSDAIKLSRLKDAKPLKLLKEGHQARFYFGPGQQLETIEYDMDSVSTVIIAPDGDSYSITRHNKPVRYETHTTQGLVTSTLNHAMKRAGISHKMRSKIGKILKAEVDFSSDVQKGDTFKVVYQKGYIGGRYTGNGDILALEFTNRGRTVKALRFEHENGDIAYYTPKGKSLERGFLRHPVKYGWHISSKFSPSRLHPTLKVRKPHLGIDYKAKRGTPILAAGNGRVQYAGRKGSFGKTIILRHNGSTKTLYAHMSKLNSGMRAGKRVKKGDIIGYVGSTGRSTGPHLHYEYHKSGRAIDPQKVKLPRSEALTKEQLRAFRAQTEIASTELNNLDELVAKR